MAAAPTPQIKGIFQSCLKPGLNRPHDVICHQGQYIVTDTFYNRVIAINPADSSSEVLCEKKQGKLASNMRPYGIVALSDSKQDFLITDAVNRCILRYVDDSCTVWSDAELPQKGLPAGITVDSSGQAYVADVENHCVRVYDENGRYCRSFGSDHLQSPWFLDINSEGHVFVTDNPTGIKIFTKEGHFLKKLVIRSENRSWYCRGIAIDRYDNIFVTVRTKGSFLLFSRENVVVFDRNYQVISSLGGLMQFNFVRGLCCDYENNHLVIVDGEWHRLQLYKLYDQQTQRHHTVSALKHQSANEDCESGVFEDFEKGSVFEDQGDDDDEPQTCEDEPQTRDDDYHYDYNHLELSKEDNIDSSRLQSETGE